jgi:hypothetical protein
MDLNKRWSQHKSGDGSMFTSLFQPESILEVEMNPESDWETKKTIEMMTKFGIQNVRGAGYCKLELTEKTIQNLIDLGCTLDGLVE